ncbi:MULTISPECIES: HTTM domain-containing protein [Streptomyces]|uniref:HTTM domain-containing protein n=2 Tax=Streptomyces TaxID=1883 RepID=A0ABT4PAR4_9ACTN|nr:MULTISPECIES: HTTM domain-containing protein [Streptomyces]MCW8117005.1 HTTM domain-containing protein [Streptomyces anthocyanicus]MCZ4638230.1 HTTM domain-containing protein [Streptomyces rubrogriseus]THA97731.1 HTTM domain-containing protein [Streptomyces sp. LRa12]WSB62230.1 HTTM domain-containing protein [Streptomyces anthocyanicus]
MNAAVLSVSRGIARVTGAALGPYQTAVIRIGFSATWLLFLLRELPHRNELYGPDGPWSHDLAEQLLSDNGAFTALMWSDGRAWFEIVYAVAVLSSVLLLLGWRTRTMSVLFMVGVLSLQNRSVFMGDGGDNVVHLMSIYLVLTRCGRVWSLDARRARRAAAARARGERVEDRVGPVLWCALGFLLLTVTLAGGLDGDWFVPALLWAVWVALGLWWAVGRGGEGSQPRILLDVVTNIVHNGALVVIMAEACLIYATAGWYKIQGSRWQDGTAVYYPLHLDYFSPWPALSDALAASGTMVMLITYGTVAVQVAFPFTLFNRRVKNVLLAAMMIEHAVIAVTLGLPFFSLAMIAADAVFLPTSFLRRLGGWAARARGRLFGRGPSGGLAKAPDGGGHGDGPGRTATVPGPRAREAGGSVAGTGAVDGKDADPTHVGFRA